MKKSEFKNIAPLLSEISKKKSGFNVPENYFSTIEEKVTETIHLKKNSFKTPSNYFNTVEDNVVAKLKLEATEIISKVPDNYFEKFEDTVFEKLNKQSKTVSLKTKIIKFGAPLAIAASLLLIFILNSESNKVTFESLATSDIENLIDNGIINIEAENLALTFPEVNVNNTTFDSTLSNEDVLEYLYEEGGVEDLFYE